MNHDRDILLRDYALSVGAADDRRLRDVLAEACLDCSQELAEAEADLATFALNLAPVAPSSGGRERVLARIRAARAALPGETPAPAPIAPLASPNRSAPTATPRAPAMAPAPRRWASYAVAAVAIIAACVGLGLISRQDARLETMSRQIQAMSGPIQATSGQIESTSRQVSAVAEAQRLTSEQVAAVEVLVNNRGIA